MDHASLDQLVRSSLAALVRDLKRTTWLGRERELVSLFVFEHLLPEGAKLQPPLKPGQVGVEVAVPQHPPHGGKRRQPNVCKDVVIWPHPRMTTWTTLGQPLCYPSAVIEWKTLNNIGVRERPAAKRAEFVRDREWMCAATCRCPQMRGYVVWLDLTKAPRVVECTCVASGVASEPWVIGP